MDQKLYRKPDQKLDRIEHWNRFPDSVLLDHALTPSARCVYAFIAGTVFQGAVASVGQRRIATMLGFSRTTVGHALDELEQRNHIKTTSFGKQRHAYFLTSNVFGTKQAALDAGESIVEDVIVSGPRRRLATVRRTA